MAPKKDKGNNQEKVSCRKKAKKEIENEASDNAEQVTAPGKKELDKMYSAMRYMKKTTGSNAPMEMYMSLTSKEEKHSFWKRFLVDRKFSWVSMNESSSQTSRRSTTTEEGWMSRFQIADAEKLPVDSQLLELCLQGLPCRAHRCAAWAEKGEKEYYYKGPERLATMNAYQKELKASREGKLKEAGFDELDEEPWNVEEPKLALEDSNVVKVEPQEAFHKQFQDYQNKVRKLTKVMSDLNRDALVFKAKLQEQVAKDKTYLQSLLETYKAQLGCFQDALNKAIGASGTMPSEVNAGTLALVKKTFDEGLAHVDAFKGGAFKEVQAVLR